MKLFSTIFCLFLIFDSQAQEATKRVVLEEFTTALCGACPPRSKEIQDYVAANPEAILVTIHEGFGRDSMSNSQTSGIYQYFKPTGGSFAPAIMIDREFHSEGGDTVYMSVPGFDSIADAKLAEEPKVKLDLGYQLNEDDRLLGTRVNINFLEEVEAAEYRISVFLVEDSVVGSGYPAYDQKCYSPAFAATYFPHLDFIDDNIIGYPHRNVLRFNLSDEPMGISSTVPALPIDEVPDLNTEYVFTSGFVSIPESYEMAQLSLVAFIHKHDESDKKENYILNATQLDIELTSTSFEEILDDDQIVLKPNPVDDLLLVDMDHFDVIPEFSVFNISGMKMNVNLKQLGSQIQLDVSHLANGIHFLVLEDGDRIIRKQFVVY